MVGTPRLNTTAISTTARNFSASKASGNGFSACKADHRGQAASGQPAGAGCGDPGMPAVLPVTYLRPEAAAVSPWSMAGADWRIRKNSARAARAPPLSVVV